MTNSNDYTPTWTARPVDGQPVPNSSKAVVAGGPTAMPDDTALRTGGQLASSQTDFDRTDPGLSDAAVTQPEIIISPQSRPQAHKIDSVRSSNRPTSSGLKMLAIVAAAMLVVLGLGAVISSRLFGGVADGPASVGVAAEGDLGSTVDSAVPQEQGDLPPTSSVRAGTSTESGADQFGTVAEARSQSTYARLDGLALYLEGTVPTQEVGDQVEARAAELLGQPAVRANYQVDPDADLPADPPLFATSAVLFEPDGTVNSGSMGTLNLAFSLLIDYPSARVIITTPLPDGLEQGQTAANNVQASAVRQFWIDKGLDPSRVHVELDDSAAPPSAGGEVLEREVEFIVRGLLED